MRMLKDCKDNIHSCSKCGLCQSVCPVYKITGNDCTVSRGLFIMLKGFLNGKVKMSSKLNKYLDMCLKCGACTKFCPSEIDVVDIVSLAKAEYFKTHLGEKLISFIQKIVLNFNLALLSLPFFNVKSQKYTKKVLYFGGCKATKKSKKSVIKFLNACNIEVLIPNFNCCGMPFYIRGDMDNFKKYMEKFHNILEKEGITEIVTSCATCEKMLNTYKKYSQQKEFSVKNIYEYIKENNISLSINKKTKVTYHKPCNLNNMGDVDWILNNIANLEYIPSDEFDECCGFGGIGNFKELKNILKITANKRKNLTKTGAKIVLTSCAGCELALKLFSFGKYRVYDMTEYLADNAMLK